MTSLVNGPPGAWRWCLALPARLGSRLEGRGVAMMRTTPTLYLYNQGLRCVGRLAAGGASPRRGGVAVSLSRAIDRARPGGCAPSGTTPGSASPGQPLSPVLGRRAKPSRGHDANVAAKRSARAPQGSAQSAGPRPCPRLRQKEPQDSGRRWDPARHGAAAQLSDRTDRAAAGGPGWVVDREGVGW